MEGVTRDEKFWREDFESEAELQDYLSQYSMQRWLLDLKEWTLETRFLPLSSEEGLAVMAHYDRRASAQQKTVLQRLQTRIDQVVESEFDPKQPLYVRLNNVDARDGVIGSERLNHNLELQFKSSSSPSSSSAPPPTDDNGAAIAWERATDQTLCLQTGKQALDIISNSSRVRQAIAQHLRRVEEQGPDHNLEDWDLFLTIRASTNADPSQLFRGFVYKGKLRAVSQQRYNCYFEVVKQNKDIIKERIDAFWKAFGPSVPLANYVFDVAVPIDDEEYKPVLIDIKPWYQATRSLLFDWKEDLVEWMKEEDEKEKEKEDDETTQQDKAKERALSTSFEFRIVETFNERRMKGFSKDLRQKTTSQICAANNYLLNLSAAFAGQSATTKTAIAVGSLAFLAASAYLFVKCKPQQQQRIGSL
ncbi:hypothetical protein QOT17_016836 [Balamuthia mandrillaris]